MLRSLTGHGYGHDDRVLPLHLHHTGTYLRVLAWVRVGLPQNKVSLGGGGDSCYRIFRLDLFPKAVGVTPEKGTICLCGPPTLRRGIVL